MPNPPALATPPATAPTSPTSPTSRFIAPLDESYPNVDLEKAESLVQESITIQKGNIPVGEWCTLHSGLALTLSKDGGLQRRFTDSLKRYTSFVSSPRTLSSHRKSDADKKLAQRSEYCY